MDDLAFLWAWVRLHAPVLRAWLGLRTPQLLRWLRRRAAERSTWIGLAMLATAAGQSVLGDHLTELAEIAPMLLGAGGAAIAAASTSRPDADEGRP